MGSPKRWTGVILVLFWSFSTTDSRHSVIMDGAVASAAYTMLQIR